jgi:hypothetical protein
MSWAILRGELVALEHDLAVHGEGLDRAVRGVEDGAAGGLVDAAALHADEAVLDEIDAADAVLAAEFVEVPSRRRAGSMRTCR